MTVEICMHSAVDVITNSSSVIYTYSQGSDKAVIEMLNEVLSAVGYDAKAEDMFHFGIFPDADELMWNIEHIDDVPEADVAKYSGDTKALNILFDEILVGTKTEPKWLKYWVANGRTDDPPETFLHVKAKFPEFEEAGRAIVRFLYSTQHYEVYDG